MEISSISNKSIIPENDKLKLYFDDNLTVDEMKERVKKTNMSERTYVKTNNPNSTTDKSDCNTLKPMEISSISNKSIVPENDKFKLYFDDNLTMDEMEERINSLLGITAIVESLIVFSLIIVIITSLPIIPTIVQPRMSVDVKKTSKLKVQNEM